MKPEHKEFFTNTEPVLEPTLECLALSVPKAGASIGLGRSAAYEAAKRGDIPTVRIGRRLLVPLEKFRQKFQ
jgi:hypothetical protein